MLQIIPVKVVQIFTRYHVDHDSPPDVTNKGQTQCSLPVIKVLKKELFDMMKFFFEIKRIKWHRNI